MITDAEHIAQYWASLAVDELVRNGIKRFCISPGSRSSPLALAVARHDQAKATIHFDERGAAFFALGWARAEGRPAAVITTSGTAVANCMPAVVEASVDGVPMILLTADRPPELRTTGANQTIRQVGLFGELVRWFFDLPVPSEDVDPTFVLTTVDQAVHRTLEDPGPVHLNWMFREPLAPVGSNRFEPPINVALGRWLDGEAPYTFYDAPERRPSRRQVEKIVTAVRDARFGVIVAGRLRHGKDGEMAMRLADILGWPILRDALSNVPGTNENLIVPHFDLLLKSDLIRKAFRPDFVLHLGARATCKELYTHLSVNAPRSFVLVAPHRDRIDAVHRVTMRVEAEVAGFCDSLIRRLDGKIEALAGTAWPANLAKRVDDLIENEVFADDKISEPAVARHLTAALPSGHDLFVSASMPVRDVDMFGRILRSGRCVANRGASGIDGTVASAVGFACGRGRPLTLLIGDLALLHDMNSLDLVRQSEQPITIVVINNDGGGVFSFLQISEFEEVFEKYFGTPHGLSFRRAAEMFSLRYFAPESHSEYVEAFRTASEMGQSNMIEVKTSRQENRDRHLQIYRAVDELAALVPSAHSEA